MHPYKRQRTGSGPGDVSPRRQGSGSGGAAGMGLGMGGRAGSESEEEAGVDEVLERHRKHAIYRQMLSYKRQHAAVAAQLARAEEARAALEGEMRSVEVCWSGLVRSLHESVGEQAGAPPDSAGDALQPQVHDLLRNHAPDLSKALSARIPPTRALFSRIAQSPNTSAAHASLQAELPALQATISTLQLAQSRLADERDEVHERLLAAQRRNDKLRAEFERLKREQEQAGPLGGAKEAAQGNGVHTPGAGGASPAANAKTETNGEDVKMEDDQPNGHARTGTPTTQAGATVRAFNAGADENERDTAWLKEKLTDKEKEIEGLRAQVVEVQGDCDFYRTLAYYPQDEVILNSTVAKTLTAALAEQTTATGVAETRYAELNSVVDSLRDAEEGYRESVLHEAREEIRQLRTHMQTNQADLLRIRQLRDVYLNELDLQKNTLKQRWDHAQAMQTLAEKRQERIDVLDSEVRRIKAKMAAGMGKEEMLAFLLNNKTDDYVQGLERDLKEAKERVVALQDELAASSAAPDARAAAQREAGLRSEVKALQEELHQLRKILRSDETLAQQLEAVAKERQILELRVQEGEAAQRALYGEVEGLTKAWEGLGQELERKVYDLRDAEGRVVKAEVEKSKALNKFYDISREKEGLMGAKTASERTIQLQRTALDKAREVENSLHAQLSEQEKSLTQLKNTLVGHQSHIEHVQTQAIGLKAEVEAVSSRHAEAVKIAKERLAEREEERAKQAQLADEIKELKWRLSEAESRAAKPGASAKAANGKEDSALRQERDMLFGILRCSACQLRFKEKIISKCLHTFCRECIETRMESRSRKCPTCMVPISHSDIRPLF